MVTVRTQAWRGGMILAARQLAGMAISFAGLVTLARLIGAEAYGVYVSALALQTALALLLQLGIDVWLIRAPKEPSPAETAQALSLALVLGTTGILLAWPVGMFAEAWIGAEGVGRAVTLLFLGMPLQLAAVVPSGLLQRRMAYRRVAWAELGGQIALYGTSVGFALAGWRLSAPLAGWWGQQIVMTALFFGLAGWRPTLRWHWPCARAMIRFGAVYAASMASWRLRDLVNPLVIARLLGPEAAANVAIAMRLVEALSFMRTVLWRVSLPALGRLQAKPGRLAQAVSEGMRLQALGIGPLLAGFALAAPWVVPLAFGEDWTRAAELFPALALVGLVTAVFSLHGSALAVLGRSADLALFHCVYAAAILLAAAMLVPRYGMAGYAAAEVAALSAYALLHNRARRRFGRVAPGLALVWTAGLALPLFADRLGAGAWAGPAAVLALPATRRVLVGWWMQIKEAAHG